MLQFSSTDDKELLTQWKAAKKLAAPLGPFSNIFSRCVRTMRCDCLESGGRGVTNLKPGTLQDLRRIFRSPTLQAMFYYALLTFHADDLKRVQHLSADEIAKILGIDALSSLISLAYLFRRARHISDPENFKRIINPLQNYVDLGFHMGTAIQEIGAAAGTIVGGFRYLAFALFLATDEKAYREYRLHLKRTHCPFNLSYEVKQWGCNHLQIGSYLLQSFGFGVAEARAYVEGISTPNFRTLDKAGMRYRVAGTWLDSLMMLGHAPETTLGDEYLVSDVAVEVLEERINQVLADGSLYHWLSKSKKDLSPEKTPQLFGSGNNLKNSTYAQQPDTEPEHDQDPDLNDFEAM